MGAMVEFVSGRNCGEVEGFRKGCGLIYWIIEGVRTPSLREARMAETAMNEATAAKKSLVRREVATVKVGECA